MTLAATLLPFLHGNRWSLTFMPVAGMLTLPAMLVTVADRLLKRRR